MQSSIDLKKLKLNIQPHVLAGLLHLNDESTMNFRELERLISSDQNMTAMILKAANSSFYGRGNEIKTPQHAIAMLGFKVVRSLALLAQSKQMFDTQSYSRFKKYVWEHSVVTAVISKHLTQKLQMTDIQEEAFIAGLLHDIGKIVLHLHDREKFIKVIDMATLDNIPFADAENKIFGTDHLKMGEEAVVQWNLPPTFKNIMACHRSGGIASADGADKKLLFVVSYANFLAKKFGFGHMSPADTNDGDIYQKELSLKDTQIKYFSEDYPKILQNDEFYKFFQTIV